MALSPPTSKIVFDYPFGGTWYWAPLNWALRVTASWHFEDVGSSEMVPGVQSVSFECYTNNQHNSSSGSFNPSISSFNHTSAGSNYRSVALCHDVYFRCRVSWTDENGNSRTALSSYRKITCPSACHKLDIQVPNISVGHVGGIIIKAKLLTAGSGMYDIVAYTLYHHTQPNNQGSIVQLKQKVFRNVDDFYNNWQNDVINIQYESGKKIYMQTHGLSAHSGSVNSAGPPSPMPYVSI